MKGKTLAIALAALGLSACGGGTSTSSSSGGTGTTGAVVGLKIPSNVSVVTAKGSSATAGGVMLTNASGQSAMGLVQLSTFPTDAQISTDPTNTYVWDDSMQSLQVVNQILCYVSQTSADQMVNKGAYTALVNEKKCEQGQNQSSSASTGQSSATQAVQYNKWTVEATRKDNNSPETVKVWVPGKANATDPQDAQTIMAEITVTAGQSGTNPFGKFSMNFKGVVDASLMGGTAGQEMTLMKGSLKTVDNSSNLPQFQFIELDGQALDSSITSFTRKDAVNVILDDSTGSTGRGKAAFTDGHDDGSGNLQIHKGSFVVDFSPNYFLRGKDANDDGIVDASEELCSSRSNFDTQVWNYNLYFKSDGTFNGKAVTAGERVALNSGFPFVYTDANGKKLNGQVGYWGMWLENDGTVPDGATITKVSYNDPSVNESDTVHVSPGRLMRRSSHTGSLTDFQGQEFQFNGMLPNSTSSGQYIVKVGDGTTLDDQGHVMPANDFVVTQSFTWGSNGMVKTDVSDVDVTPTRSGDSLNLYSDALGGQVNFVYDSNVTAANRQITYYTQDTVYPGDTGLFANGAASATLYCYEQCLKGGLTASDVSSATSDQDLFYTSSGNTPYQYTATVVNGNLVVKDQNGKVVSANGLDLSGLGHDWGIDTGEMVLDNSAITNPWDVYGQPVTYHWETGSNDYNHTVTVTDASGNTVTFDQPLSFTYIHLTANDANGSSAYNGQTFVLQYGGPGQLWGFPSTEDASGRWQPSVSLADGTELTDAQGNVFVVKEMEREQHMKNAVNGVADCTGDGLAANGTLDNSGTPANDPTKLALPSSSDIGTVSFTLADRPDVTGAPAVIEGEVQ